MSKNKKSAGGKTKDSEAEGAVPVTIKKYANRRLYNTASSSYVTLDHLRQMVQEDIDFVVYDAKSGEDITRSVLTQIIVEEEAKGQNLLPINFLRQLISLYGDSMQWMVPGYLDQTMNSFAHNQEQLRQSMQDTLGGMFPFPNLNEMSKQQMAAFEQAMRMFTPFGLPPSTLGQPAGPSAADPSQTGPRSTAQNAPEGAPEGPPDTDARKESLDRLKAQVDQLQSQLDALADNED